MADYYKKAGLTTLTKTNTIFNLDCLEALKQLPDNSVDSCVTDPPYGLSKEPNITEVLTKWMNGEPYDHGHKGFMGKEWDSFVPHPDIWKEVYRVLKPGAYALVFAGTRTQDLMTIGLRLAGFEVRDVVEWLYFSGFPKSMDISKALDKRAGAERVVVGSSSNPNGKSGGYTGERYKEKRVTAFGVVQDQPEKTAPSTDLAKKYEGWGTQLKPAHEPIIMVRKPLEKKTVVDNVLEYGTGGLNIDASRITFTDEKDQKGVMNGNDEPSSFTSDVYELGMAKTLHKRGHGNEQGRFPANAITLEDDQFYSKFFNITPQELSKKASKKDRNSDYLGNEIDLEEKSFVQFQTANGTSGKASSLSEGRKTKYRNTHPTVKPVPLMEWLVKLITPESGTVLDPFSGSGSTLVAAKKNGFNYIGCELSKEYVEIIKARLGETV